MTRLLRSLMAGAIALSLAPSPTMAQTCTLLDGSPCPPVNTPSADDPPLTPAERAAWRDVIVCVLGRAFQGEEPSGETCQIEWMRVAFEGVARGRPDADIFAMTNAFVGRATALAQCRNAVVDGGRYGDDPSPDVVGKLCPWRPR